MKTTIFRSIKRVIPFFIIALFLGCKKDEVNVKNIEGMYEGVFKRGNFTTPIQFEIEKDSLNYNVYFTSPDQNAYKIPTTNVAYKNDSISFELNSDYYSFKFRNKIAEDGTFINANLAVDSINQSFVLHKIVNTNTTRQEEVTFQSDNLSLTGTIFYPSKTSNKVLYFVTSSGNADRSASRAEAIQFANQGFITFHFDKRGTGTSEGNWKNSSMESLANDDINALKFLSKKLAISPSNIGIKGSSQGGTKVPLILSKMPELAYGIVVSCPATSLLESDLNYWKNRNQPHIQENYFEDAFALERLVFQYIAGTTTLEVLEEQLAKNKDKPWFSKVWIPNLAEVEIDNKLQFSPIPYFKKINQPIFIIQGTEDEIIPAFSSDSIFNIAQKKNKQSNVISIIGANHSMQQVKNNDFTYWPMLHPDYLPAIYNWLDKL